MQDRIASSPAEAADVLAPLTTVHFILIAVLAVIAIVGIAYGMKQARRRREGTRELEEAGHLERTGDTPTVDPDAPGEAIVAREPAPIDRAAPGGDTAPVVQVAPPIVPTIVPPTSTPVMEPTPAAEPTPIPAIAPVTAESDLTLLKGLGPKVATMLVDLGIPDIATLARLDDAAAERIAGQLGIFAPRMARDRWLEQARLLAVGDKAGFEAKFGKL